MKGYEKADMNVRFWIVNKEDNKEARRLAVEGAVSVQVESRESKVKVFKKRVARCELRELRGADGGVAGLDAP